MKCDHCKKRIQGITWLLSKLGRSYTEASKFCWKCLKTFVESESVGHRGRK